VEKLKLRFAVLGPGDSPDFARRTGIDGEYAKADDEIGPC